MIKIKINDKEYDFASSWDDISMKQYCHMFYNLPTADSEASDEEKMVQTIENEATIISRLLGEKDDFAMNLPFEIYNRLQEACKFIYSLNGFLDSKVFYLNIDGRRYWMPEPKDMSLRQYIDADIIMKEEGNESQFIELLACLLLPYGDDGKYEYDGKYQELIPRIERMKASEGLPFIYTFFKKKELSKKVMEGYSKVEEVANRLLHNI